MQDDGFSFLIENLARGSKVTAEAALKASGLKGSIHDGFLPARI